jgi:hypothetical protein
MHCYYHYAQLSYLSIDDDYKYLDDCSLLVVSIYNILIIDDNNITSDTFINNTNTTANVNDEHMRLYYYCLLTPLVIALMLHRCNQSLMLV